MNASVPFAAAIVRTLADALAGGSALTVITEGHGPSDELAARFPGRVLALPVADRANLGIAAGIALAGRPAVVEVAGTGRLPALIEVLVEAARAPEDFRGPLVLRVPYGPDVPGLDGPALDLLGAVPGLVTVCPRDAGTAAALLREALGRPGPTVFLEPRALLRSAGAVGGSDAVGAVVPLRPGRDVTLAAFGGGVGAALDAAEALAREGISAEVVDLGQVTPVDHRALGEHVRRTGRLVVAVPPGEEAWGSRALEAALSAFWFLETAPRSAPPEASALVAAARDAVHD